MQHFGSVDGNAQLSIKFGSYDVHDVLRSLIFEDQAGGIVRSVEYQPAPDPEDIAARQIGQPMTLAQLLQRFRGEEVNLTIDGSTATGTIYGVENRAGEKQTVETLVLMREGSLQSVPLSKIDHAQFANPEIQKDLQLALAGLVKSRKANQKQLDIYLEGEGKRDVRFAYVVDVPIWRMTYRLSVDDGKGYLQGWAHVDNVTGVDWNDIEIELRSGSPQAFHVNVFSPMMSARPEFGNSVYRFTQGLQLLSDMFESNSGNGGGGLGGGGLFGGSGFGGGSGGDRSDREDYKEFDVTSAFRASAIETRAAQMVRFEFKQPVSIGAGKSAAIPLMSKEIPVKLVSLYIDGEESTVLRAIQMTNSNELPLVSGPIAVFQNGSFVGDASLGRLNPDDSTEIVYGIDRAVEAERTHMTSKTFLRKVAIGNRKIEFFRETISEFKFNINNRDIESRDLVLKFNLVALDAEFSDIEELKLSPEPQDLDGPNVAYTTEVEAQSTKEIPITISRSELSKDTFDSVSSSTIASWQNMGAEISEADLAVFKEFAEYNRQIDELRFGIADLQSQMLKADKDQERIRKNLEAVSGNADAAEVYIEKLADLESKIEEWAKSVKDKQVQIQSLSKTKQDRIVEISR